MVPIDFTSPYWLLLLPLSLLPCMARGRDTTTMPWTGWLPADSIGARLNIIWMILSILLLIFLIIGLAGPGKSQISIERIGRGAELSIVLDRSASMDTNIRRLAPNPGEAAKATQTKNDVVRETLIWLINQRPENRYSLTLFNTAAIHVAPFLDDPAIAEAGLSASAIGRGPNKTNMGLALLSAIQRFDNRKYSGSRALLLVSDGGAKLDQRTRQDIREGLQRNQISLYFVYVQSSPNSPNLETVGKDPDTSIEEVALHIFFEQLGTEYRVFQADNPESMAAAVTEIDQLQNLPLTYQEQIPRLDYSNRLYLAALLCCAGLVLIGTVRLEQL